jgi:CO/xanthine dehydrogenase FAD-binding subunit
VAENFPPSATALEAIPSKSAAIPTRRFMINCEEYFLAHSVQQALQALAGAPGPARIVAGGTDLLLDLDQGRHAPLHTLVDITQIPELNQLEHRAGRLFIGAAVPHNKIAAAAIVAEHAQALVEACGLIGGPQVRNVATLGGNVAHALPAADGTIALMALDASAEIATLEGTRVIPLSMLFQGPGQNTLDARKELLTGFYLPLRTAGQASAFQRVMRPQGVAIAILNCAVWLHRAGNAIQDIRISFGPSGPTPCRMTAAEELLCGKAPTDQTLSQAHTAVLQQANFRTSRHRATLGYRQEMAAVLLQGTIQAAWEQAKL